MEEILNLKRFWVCLFYKTINDILLKILIFNTVIAHKNDDQL
jgi:hypothetical protein